MSGQSVSCIAPSKLGTVVPEGFRCVQQSAFVLRKIIVHLKPAKLAFIVYVERRLKCVGILQGSRIQVHSARVVIRFKSPRGAARLAKVPSHSLRAFERFRRLSQPPEVFDRDPKPPDHRCRTIATAIVTVTVAGPRDLALILPTRVSAKANGLASSFRPPVAPTGPQSCWPQPLTRWHSDLSVTSKREARSALFQLRHGLERS